jgi:hypothetical protein
MSVPARGAGRTANAPKNNCLFNVQNSKFAHFVNPHCRKRQRWEPSGSTYLRLLNDLRQFTGLARHLILAHMASVL